MNGWHKTVLALMFAIFAAFIWGWTYAPSPYQPTGTDYIEPVKVKRGQVFTVYRSFTWRGTDKAFIQRSMLRRDCAVECTFKQLESGNLTLEPGFYDRLGRAQRVPDDVTPGVYDLIYVLYWHNIIGREVSEHLPRLSIEVLP